MRWLRAWWRRRREPVDPLEAARRAVRSGRAESRRVNGDSLRGKGQGGDARLASDAMDAHGGPP